MLSSLVGHFEYARLVLFSFNYCCYLNVNVISQTFGQMLWVFFTEAKFEAILTFRASVSLKVCSVKHYKKTFLNTISY